MNTTWAREPLEVPRVFLHRIPLISSPSSINTYRIPKHVETLRKNKQYNSSIQKNSITTDRCIYTSFFFKIQSLFSLYLYDIPKHLQDFIIQCMQVHFCPSFPRWQQLFTFVSPGDIHLYGPLSSSSGWVLWVRIQLVRPGMTNENNCFPVHRGLGFRMAGCGT